MGCHALSYSVWFVVDRATCCNTFPHTKLISYSVVYYSSMWGSEFLKTLWKMEERRDPDLSHSWPFYLKHCQRRVHVYELWACKGISAYQFADVRGDKKINKNTAKIREKFEKKKHNSVHLWYSYIHHLTAPQVNLEMNLALWRCWSKGTKPPSSRVWIKKMLTFNTFIHQV